MKHLPTRTKYKILVNVVTSVGIKAAIELTANDDKAPRPTNVFMFGDPLIRLFRPSIISCRPGTSNVNRDRVIWKPVE